MAHDARLHRRDPDGPTIDATIAPLIDGRREKWI
jgi:hypothetical protein